MGGSMTRDKTDRLMKTYHIPFTQYMLPDGRKSKQNFATEDRDVWRNACILLNAGFCFEAEILRTGDVSFTVTNVEDGDYEIAVCPNDASVVDAIGQMLSRACEKLQNEKEDAS